MKPIWNTFETMTGIFQDVFSTDGGETFIDKSIAKDERGTYVYAYAKGFHPKDFNVVSTKTRITVIADDGSYEVKFDKDFAKEILVGEVTYDGKYVRVYFDFVDNLAKNHEVTDIRDESSQ